MPTVNYHRILNCEYDRADITNKGLRNELQKSKKKAYEPLPVYQLDILNHTLKDGKETFSFVDQLQT